MSDFKDGHNFFAQQQQKSSLESSQFTGAPGSGPGSLTNLFSSDPFPESDIRSFSELLAGAIANQLPATGELTLVTDNWGTDNDHMKGDKRNDENGSSGFKQNRPVSLVLPPVAPVFNVSPGFSPSSFLNSPFMLSPLTSISPQQTLAHINALSQAHLTIQTDHTLPLQSSSMIPSSNHTFQPSIFTAPPRQPVPDLSSLERRPPHHNNFPIAVDKPADDGYNWRKYGQKQVKGSEYPRSYYRCTSPNCPVKKKVERSFDGHITEIIYKGQHNHERPQNGRRGNKDTTFVGDEGQFGNSSLWPGREYDSAQATSMQLNGPSDSEESGENSEHVEDDDYNDEPKPKRRNGGAGQSEGGITHRTMTEPKIVVQTRSDIDLLDDGYRWRKYGQKVVKGNPNPRSYYKCTTTGCKVRKHVERASTDSSAVITTYEGKHNHDVPAARGSAVHAANIEANQVKLPNSVAQMSFGTNDNQRPITLRLKEEQLGS